MAIIQVLIHFNTISIGVTISNLGIDIQDTLEYTSPIYRMELAMRGRIFAQNPHLYGNIPMFNPNTPKILLEHKITLEKISNLIISKNLEEFTSIFNQTAEFFNDFKQYAMDESNYLIEKMSEYQGEKNENQPMSQPSVSSQ